MNSCWEAKENSASTKLTKTSTEHLKEKDFKVTIAEAKNLILTGKSWIECANRTRMMYYVKKNK